MLLSSSLMSFVPSRIITTPFLQPDSDSEELSSTPGGWPPVSGTRSQSGPARKRRPASPSSRPKPRKKKHKHLSLLLEEAGLSSSDDSFDQGY